MAVGRPLSERLQWGCDNVEQPTLGGETPPTLVLFERAALSLWTGPNTTRPLADDEITELLGAVAPDRRDARLFRPRVDTSNDHLVILPAEPVLAEVANGRVWVYLDHARRWVALTTTHLDVYLASYRFPTIAMIANQHDDPAATRRAVIDLVSVGAIRTLAPEPFRPPELDTSTDPGSTLVAAFSAARDLLRQRLQRRAPATHAIEVITHPPESTDASESRIERIPVLSFWATSEGPHLGAAAVVAHARVWAGGRLTERYEFHRAVHAERMLDKLRRVTGPAIVLSSNYLWSKAANLEMIRQAQEINPGIVVVHGGPSTPKYRDECEQFLRNLHGVHIAVHGEGEITFAELLDRVLSALDDGVDPRSRLDDLAGVRYLDPDSGDLIVNADRVRHPDLEDFPSPLASGELDEVPPDVLEVSALPIETNRGCPYGCTFCDWGQATMTRVRKFPMERVAADFEWLANRGVRMWVIADANFGMLPRDRDVAEAMIATHRRTGLPDWIAVAPPKNTMRRFVELIDRLLDAGISMKTALALQTRDEVTLAAIDRSNIGTSAYDLLAVELRRRGLPLTCDLMVGLPGATVQTLADDLQWCVDQNARAFLFPTFVLPNAPMNDPDYRERYGIRTRDGLIVETKSFGESQRREMERLSFAYVLFEGLGVLRHVLRFLQWDHDRPAIRTIRDILDTVEGRPSDYPLLAWLLEHADVLLLPTIGWGPFFDEVHRLLVDDLGIPDGADLRAVLNANRFVLPWRGRSLPESLRLEHDYVSYFAEADAALARTGEPSRPSRPLRDFGPGDLTVIGDPDRRCETGLGRIALNRSRPGFVGDFWITTHLELLTQLTTAFPLSPEFIHAAREAGINRLPSDGNGPTDPMGPTEEPGGDQPVQITRR